MLPDLLQHTRTHLPRCLYSAHTEILRIPTPPTLNRAKVKGVKRPRRGTNRASSSRRHAVASARARFKDVAPEEKGSTKFSHFADDTLMSRLMSQPRVRFVVSVEVKQKK